MSLELVDLLSVGLQQGYLFTILVKDRKPGGISHTCLYMWGEFSNGVNAVFLLFATLEVFI